MAFFHILLSKQHLGIFIGSVLWLLLSCSFCFGYESDVNCLKSIKNSLEDPLVYLSSWDFNNNTEGFICNFQGIECWHPHESRVLNIKLSGLGLKGQFPRGIANCTSVTGIDLSSNKFYGSIPPDIDGIISFITHLDLSSNNLSGEIPTNLSHCCYLNVLRLDNNQFSGNIPLELGRLNRIIEFSVANNQLSGQVPDFGNTSITADSYANNPGLCGKPLYPCRLSHKKSISLVKVLKSNSVGIAAAACFGFPFSFCFFLPRAPSVRSLWVFSRGFKFKFNRVGNYIQQMSPVLHRSH